MYVTPELFSETKHLYSGFKLYTGPKLTGGQQKASFWSDYFCSLSVVGIRLFRQYIKKCTARSQGYKAER